MPVTIDGTVTELTNLSLTARSTSRISYDYLTAFDMGPVALGDSSERLYAYPWRIRADGNDVYICRANDANDAWLAEALLFTYSGNAGTEFNLTFDQVGRAFVSFEQDGNVVIYWYDSALGATTITTLCVGRTPRCRLDFRGIYNVADSDILLFYINDADNKVYYRVQRDRFGVVYESGITGTSTLYLEGLYPASNYRMYLYYTSNDIDTENCVCTSKRYYHSSVYPVPCEIENVEIGVSAIISGSKAYNLPIEDEYYIADMGADDSIILSVSSIISGSRREIIHEDTIEIDYIEISLSSIISGSKRIIINEYTTEIDSIELGPSSIVEGSRRQIIIEAVTGVDTVEIGSSEIVSGSKEIV